MFDAEDQGPTEKLEQVLIGGSMGVMVMTIDSRTTLAWPEYQLHYLLAI